MHLAKEHSKTKKNLQFAVPEHIRHNMRLPIVQWILELEERLVSIRIEFEKIRQCGYKWAQMGLIGSIINVPVTTEIIQKALPQCINETTIILVSLKRRLDYRSAYQIGKVWAITVMKALKKLCSKQLYNLKTFV